MKFDKKKYKKTIWIVIIIYLFLFRDKKIFSHLLPNPHLLTSIVVLVVATILFQRHRAVHSIPALVAAALPHQLTAHVALAMLGATVIKR